MPQRSYWASMPGAFELAGTAGHSAVASSRSRSLRVSYAAIVQGCWHDAAACWAPAPSGQTICSSRSSSGWATASVTTSTSSSRSALRSLGMGEERESLRRQATLPSLKVPNHTRISRVAPVPTARRRHAPLQAPGPGLDAARDGLSGFGHSLARAIPPALQVCCGSSRSHPGASVAPLILPRSRSYSHWREPKCHCNRRMVRRSH